MHRVRAAWLSGADGAAAGLAAVLEVCREGGAGAAAIEAVVADAEERWARGLEAGLGYYESRLPSGVVGPELRRALLMCEVARRGDEPEAAVRAELLSRHPDLGPEIDAVVAMAALLRPAAVEGALEDGDRVGKYALVRRLGAGSFGEVWQARDEELGRYVALKVLGAGARTGSGGDLTAERLLDEARAVAALHHEHVVRVHDAGRFEGEPGDGPGAGRFYIDTELAGDAAPTPGDPAGVAVAPSLEGWPERAAGMAAGARAREAARIVEALALGVAAAHARGIVHRDLKPSNALLTPSGRPLVVDFGLSLAAGPDETEGGEGDLARTVVVRTERGRVVGTPAFMAPEQARGEAATPLTDVFGLGAVLRYLLTGKGAYEASGRHSADARLDVIAQARGGECVRLAGRGPAGVPRTLACIADRAMAASPGDRYVSAEQLAADLRAWLEHRPTVADRPGPARAPGLWYRRNALPATIGLAAAVVIAGGTARFVHRLGLERDRAVAAEAAATQRRAEAEEARDTAAAVNQFMQETLFLGMVTRRGEHLTAQELMESAVKRIGPTLSGRPLVEAGVRHAVGVNLHRIGNLDRARVQLERALEMRRERLGIDAGETLRTRVGRCQGLRSRPSAARWPLATFVRPPGGRQEGRSGANRRVEYLGAPGSDPWAPT